MNLTLNIELTADEVNSSVTRELFDVLTGYGIVYSTPQSPAAAAAEGTESSPLSAELEAHLVHWVTQRYLPAVRQFIIDELATEGGAYPVVPAQRVGAASQGPGYTRLYVPDGRAAYAYVCPARIDFPRLTAADIEDFRYATAREYDVTVKLSPDHLDERIAEAHQLARMAVRRLRGEA